MFKQFKVNWRDGAPATTGFMAFLIIIWMSPVAAFKLLTGSATRVKVKR
jgi:hypothetical protein